MILPSRSVSEPTIEVDYSITGIPAPGEDKTYLQTLMTVDEKSPIVQFDEAPTPNKNPLDDSNLEVTMFEVVIFEEGGMPEGDLTINWAFKRSGLILTDGQSSSIIPYKSYSSSQWIYSGSVDFTDGINVELLDGDELIWWINVVDRAGNEARGTGLSMIDPMDTDFTVLSFDVTVTKIEISLADVSTIRGNEVVEGTEIGVVVQVKNLGTKSGTVTISLMEDLEVLEIG